MDDDLVLAVERERVTVGAQFHWRWSPVALPMLYCSWSRLHSVHCESFYYFFSATIRAMQIYPITVGRTDPTELSPGNVRCRVFSYANGTEHWSEWAVAAPHLPRHRYASKLWICGRWWWNPCTLDDDDVFSLTHRYSLAIITNSVRTTLNHLEDRRQTLS